MPWEGGPIDRSNSPARKVAKPQNTMNVPPPNTYILSRSNPEIIQLIGGETLQITSPSHDERRSEIKKSSATANTAVDTRPKNAARSARSFRVGLSISYMTRDSEMSHTASTR